MSNIVTVPSGNFTPGAQATLDFAAAVINAAWSQANTKQDEFGLKVDAAEGWLDTAVVADLTANVAPVPTVIEPEVAIPTTQSATDVMALFDTKYTELVALLADKFTSFRTTYFPNENTTYAAAESWLAAALANPTAGLPTAVADQVLEEDRSRILTDAARAADATMAVFAARRFPLPPGAAAAATLQIQQKAQEEIAASSRKLTTLSIEQMRFAVEKTLGLRQIAMGAAVEYIKALAAAPDTASGLVNVGYDAQSKLISAAASYYNARTNAKQLVTQAEQFNVTAKLGADEKNQAVDIKLVEERLRLLVSEAQQLGQTAASLFNNLHATAGTSYQVNGSVSE